MSNPRNDFRAIGRLTGDPALRTTSSGKDVCNMRIAVDGLGGKDAVGFIDVACWNSPGKACHQHLSSGWTVAVAGDLEIAPWERDGTRGVNVSIPFAKVTFLTAPRAPSSNTSDTRDHHTVGAVAGGDIPF